MYLGCTTWVPLGHEQDEMGASESKPEQQQAAPTENSPSTERQYSLRDEVTGLVIDSLMLYGMFLSAKFLYKTLKPTIDEFRQGENSRSKLSKRLTRSGRPQISTTHFEEVIAQDLVDPQDMEVLFSDIGGLSHQKQEIHDLVILPLKKPEFFASKGRLLQAPKGILLYGRPGTGKTMLAKAIAKESGAFFIDLKISTIMSKWFGESQKLVKAAFTLARKLAPCIIFIDEVDSFMGKRGGGSDQTYAYMKTEFLALWDGFTEMNSSDTNNGFGVLIIGATNRPADVDPAFLRRMPRTFEIPLPDRSQREDILRLLLRDEQVSSDFSIRQLSVQTVDYSGSDLKELCRAALMLPLREHLQSTPDSPMRPLCMDDFVQGMKMVQPTGATAYDYATQNEDEMPQMDMNAFATLMAAGMQNLMQQRRS